VRDDALAARLAPAVLGADFRDANVGSRGTAWASGAVVGRAVTLFEFWKKKKKKVNQHERIPKVTQQSLNLTPQVFKGASASAGTGNLGSEA